MEKYFLAAKKQCSTLALVCALVASTALALVNCTDPAPPATFTVTFDTNGGTPAIKDKTVEDGKLLAKPATEPAKERYSFVGWYKDKALTQVFNFFTEKITANITLYAKWIEAHTVTFNANGGTNVDPQTVESGKKASKPTDPTKKGHTFENWYTNAALDTPFDFNGTITQNTTLYAKWKSNLVTIPDDNFRAKLKALIPDAFVGEKLDATHGEVTGREQLDVSTSDADSIKDLTGVQHFTALTTLDCSGNSLAELDISNNIALRGLKCYNNQLTALDVSNNTALEVLLCEHNALTRLDVSNNTKLLQLWCFGNQLTLLDIRGVRFAVQPLNIYEGAYETNDIDTLKVHENIKEDDEIKELKNAEGAGITIATYSAVDESTTYTSVCGNYNPNTDACLLAEIPDANFRARLKALIPGAFVGELLDTTSYDVTEREQLDVSSFRTNRIKDLTGIQYFTGVRVLICKINSLTELDLSKNVQLRTLDCGDNGLATLDVSKNTELLRLDCASNQLGNLDVSENARLKSLHCNDNQLDSLDVSNNTALTELYCFNNQLAKLDVSRNTQLTELYCSKNQLAKLDVSKNTQLTELFCTDNRLTSLNVSKNTALVRLSCHHNQLAYLDVRGMRSDHSKMRYIWYFKIHPFSGDPDPKSNAIKVLKVHESLKDHGEIKVEKTARGDEMTIETYSATFGSVWYTLVCSNYDPTATGGEENRGVGTCDNEAQDTVVYTVTFDLNGGSSTSAEKTVRAGKLLTQPQPEPTKTDSTFAGWYKDQALTQAFNFSTDNVTADITLYAKWVPKGTEVTYTVAFNLNGGMPNEASKTVETGTLLTKPSPDPTKTNSLFLGWYKDAGFAQAFNFDSDPITATITLYARWASNKLTKANRHLLSRVDASRKVTIMEGVVSIGSEAFLNNDLTAVVFPNSLKAIEGNAFETNRLASVTIPDSVTTIGEYAFTLNNLTSVVIPNSVTTIGSGAFKSNNLATVTLTKKLYDSLSSDELADRFGSQVATYQTPDGTKLNNRDVTDANN